MVSPSRNILYSGDYVVEADGIKTESKDMLMKVINDSKGRSVELTVMRNGKSVKTVVSPKENALHEYKAGIWVRDDLQGVGTLTFIDENGRFGALGHGITDVDTGVVMEVDGGSIYETKIVNLKRGMRGEPGEMTGQIVYDDRYVLGKVEENSEKGVYGTCDPDILEFCTFPAMPIGLKQSVKIGPAQILCTVEDQPKMYDVMITAVHNEREADTRGIELKVTDERLLGITGGIIQGMSGSPIIQGGRIVGAVTHVLVSTPEKGYGIFIENMLK